MSFRTSAVVRNWFLAAGRRLARGEHRETRQSDQEMLYYEWTQPSAGDKVHLLILPEEYYCPNVDYHPARSGGDIPKWATSWEKRYVCRSVHNHAEPLLRELNATLPAHQELVAFSRRRGPQVTKVNESSGYVLPQAARGQGGCAPTLP